MRLRTRTSTALLLCAMLLCAMFAAVPARAAVTEIVAGPGAQAYGSYVTPVVVAAKGAPLTLLNQDVQPHSVMSDEIGPGTQPWCGFFAPSACPLLWARTADAGGRTQPVLGLENAVSGRAYGLHCAIHPDVKGRLVVV